MTEAPRTAPAARSTVVVIGAGFAGLSAAVRLADAGLSVIVAEEAPRLGGRATAFADRDTGERVDNGQHVLFGCYRETYAFLERLGTAGKAPAFARFQRASARQATPSRHHAITPSRLQLTMASMDGRAFDLTCPAWRPPWHLLGGVLGWRALPLRDRLSAIRLACVLRDVRRLGAAEVAARTPAADTVSTWLRAHGQRAQLCEWLWRPLAIAALNQSPDTAAARPFVRVLGELFGPRVEDSAIGVPSVPLDDLYAAPAAEFIRSRGGAVLTKSPARISFDKGDRITRVIVGEVVVTAKTVISAVPWHALGRIWETGPPGVLAATIANASQMQNSPIVTVNLWLDRAVMPQPFIGLVGGTMHWAFDKSAIFGERAGHLSMVASGAVGLVDKDNAAVTAIAVRDLGNALPVARHATVQRAVVVREHRATWSLAPGTPPRPGTRTALPGFYLAGDWTDTGLPGTIESAVTSGHAAADAVLEDWRALEARTPHL